ncbi:MAG: hypothetical protein ACREJU_14040 [Nitrospiraceae bacterium]
MVVLLVGLPLFGIFLDGKPVGRYLEFPPLTRYVEHTGFSWLAFIGLAVFLALLLGPFLVSTGKAEKRVQFAYFKGRPFPWWGWGGAGLIVLAWVLAWTRFPWFSSLQPFTFSPLWLGYIVVVNALAFSRTGSCMMLDRPRYFLSLFLLSAAFWWFFEYLNRFVQNWYYVGGGDFTPFEYVVHATLPFSTVLPAVLGTTEWLKSFSRLSEAFGDLWPVWIRHPKAFGWIGLILSSAGLMGIGIWPNALFPLLWVSPLLIITSLQAIRGESTIFSGATKGDWRPIWLPALAGLICGFFWEMWNVNSLAHWEYAVPLVHRFEMFEMPLLGYAGYLPFGVECQVVADLLPHDGEQRAGFPSRLTKH